MGKHVKSALVKVKFRAVRDLPESIREKHGLGNSGFVEVRIMNSTPQITYTKIKSPGMRLRGLIDEAGVDFKLQ